MSIVLADHNPETLEEAVDILVSNINDEERVYLSQINIEELHHSLGRHIRNEWKLWEPESKLHKFFVEEYGLGHADDMSGIILYAFHARVMNKEYDPRQTAHEYQKFWSDQKIDPVTQESFS